MSFRLILLKRTGNSFSRSPVDLTLEQTLNADAASRRTGLSSVANNYSACLRWMLTKSTKAAIICKAQKMVGLYKAEDSTAELRPAHINGNSSDLQKIIAQIKSSCNPFQMYKTHEKLFTSAPGKQKRHQSRHFCLLAGKVGR